MLNLDSSSWTRAYGTTLNAKPVPGKRGEFQAIPDLRVPISLDSHSLLVGASSLKLKPRWKLGFWLSMQIGKIPGIGQPTYPEVAIPIGLLYVKFPKLTDSYNLIVKVPYWHTQMSIEIWKYKGVELTSLDSLETQLTQIGQKLGVSTQVILPGQIPGLFF